MLPPEMRSAAHPGVVSLAVDHAVALYYVCGTFRNWQVHDSGRTKLDVLGIHRSGLRAKSDFWYGFS